jgi:small multidrug resistance family-3 protein
VTARSIALFIAAAIAEIGGAYLVWVSIKEHKGVAFVALGAMALTAYGVVAAFQPSHEFGRVLAAYGGVFIVGSLLWASPSRLSPRPRRSRRRGDLPGRRRRDHVRALGERAVLDPAAALTP